MNLAKNSPFFLCLIPIMLISIPLYGQKTDASKQPPVENPPLTDSLKETKTPGELELESKLNDISTSVNDLKEKVYKSKAKLKLMEETLLLGKITGSKAIVRFKNNTGGLFNITAGEYYLNGKLVYKFNPNKDQNRDVVIFDSETPPGNNKIKLKLSFTGADSGVLKLFSYFKDYKFNMESDYEFPVTYGKTTVVNIEGVDLGPFKNSLDERLSVRYKTMTEDKSTIPF